MKRKQYPIDQSPLYKIQGLGQLKTRLGISLEMQDRLTKPSNYKAWIENERAIQHPRGHLNKVHSDIARMLAKIETPQYVHHKKGRSHVSNARAHTGFHPVAKTDIAHYYPSISRLMLKKMFIEQFRCSIDVSNFLARICTYDQRHLPTGSPLSGYLAYWASKKFFDEIYDLTRTKSCAFTLYVDDLTISGSAATKQLVYEIKNIALRHGLKLKVTKSKTFNSHATKIITGVAVKGNGSYLPNSKHKSIADTKAAISRATDKMEKNTLLNSLKGKLMAARQILTADEDSMITYNDLDFT